MASYQILLRKNKPKKDGTYPIIFKVYLGGKSKIITLPYSCNKFEWDEVNKKFRRNYPKYKEINSALKVLDTRLQNAIDELETQEIDFNLDDIYKSFKHETSKNKVKIITVHNFFVERIKELNDTNRFGYAKAIKDTKTSLFKFAKKDLRFKEITPEFLDKYEIFLRKSCSDGGIAFRMRDIRTIYNKAIKYGYVKEDSYPFKTYKISKLKSNSHKIAITKEEFEKLKKFNIVKYPKYENTFKMFLFSYYAGGMNFKDMIFLKLSNIIDDRLIYQRDKTKEYFNFKLPEPALEIINFFNNKEKTESLEFVFPIILKPNLTKKQLHGRYKRCLKKFNKELKFIGEKVEIDKNITSYVARHSFATHLKFNGVSEDVISQLMGHSDVSVTKAYLKDFGSSILDDAMNKLN